MKFCEKCGRQLADAALFCTLCGAKQPNIQKNVFCESCGGQMGEDEKACPHCGQPVAPVFLRKKAGTANFFKPKAVSNVVTAISGRERMSALLWFAAAALQVVCGCLLLPGRLVPVIALFAVAAFNAYRGIASLRFARRILDKPVGIVKYYENMLMLIIAIAGNGFLLAWGLWQKEPFMIGVGFFAVVLAVLGFLVRKFALDCRNELEQIEARGRA